MHELMSARPTQAKIAEILGRHKSTISRELMRGSGQRGYRPRQAQRPCDERSRCSRNALHIAPEVWDQAEGLLGLQWSLGQIASQLQISHKTVYQKRFTDKVQGGHLWHFLRRQKKAT
jgi:IS30 family transposase